MHLGMPLSIDPISILTFDLKIVVRAIAKIVIIVLFGAFGGFVNGVSKLVGRIEGSSIVSGGNPAALNASLGVPTRTYLLLQTIIGSGGAFAAVFGILTIGNATRAAGSSDITVNPIYLVTLCVVGGFVGNRLLVQVGKNLGDKISSLEVKTEDTARLVRETDHEVKAGLSRVTKSVSDVGKKAEELVNKAPKMGLDINAAKGLVRKLESYREHPLRDATSQRERAEKERLDGIRILEDLQGHLQAFPKERVLNIVSANLAFELGLALNDDRLERQAFDRLCRFIGLRREDGLPESDDDETAYFNLACYSSVLSSLQASRVEQEKMLREAENSLRQSLGIAERRGGDSLSRRFAMHSDPELQALFASPFGEGLLAEFKAKLETQLRNDQEVLLPA